MSVETPDMDELLRLVPTVGYGDDAPADRRGGALHLSAVLPALSAAIGHPTPTKAVSYTHLDVYKRQGLGRLKNRGNQCDGPR